MCRSHHPIKDYCLRSNLTNWAISYALASALNIASRMTPDDYQLAWVAGASYGLLFMWALEIGREWLKRKL